MVGRLGIHPCSRETGQLHQALRQTEDYYDAQAARYDTDAEVPYLSHETPRGDPSVFTFSY